MAAAPEPLIVKRNLSSICSSAKVGQYFGFYNREGAAWMITYFLSMLPEPAVCLCMHTAAGLILIGVVFGASSFSLHLPDNTSRLAALAAASIALKHSRYAAMR